MIASAPSVEAVLRRVPISRRRLVRMELVGVPLSLDEAEARSRADEYRRQLGVDDGDSVVTSIGNLLPSKSHHFLLSAASKVVADRPTARFFIVGEGPLRASLQQQIDDSGLQEHVFLLGQRTDVERVLAATDVYVRPGVIEGLAGLTVFEAHAFELPIVTFDTMDVRVAVSHMETGLIVPPGDAGALAHAIVRLLDDPALARSLGRAGRRQVEERFSIAAVVDDLESLYRETLRQRGGGRRRFAGRRWPARPDRDVVRPPL